MIPCAHRPWLRARAAATPHADAVIVEDHRLGYDELAARVDRTIGGLHALGVRPGEVVAALLPNGLPLIELFHATCALGAILLPLNLRLSVRELRFQLGDSAARWLVHGSSELAAWASEVVEGNSAVTSVDLPALEVAAAAGAGGDAEPLEGSPPGARDPVALLYTSGTTGEPKGALLSTASFHASALGSAELLGAEPGDRWLACLPLYHVGGLSILVRSVLVGSCAVVHAGFDPDRVNRALDHEGITRISLVATMLRRLLDARSDRPAPRSLRCVLLGGGPTPPMLLERALALGFPVAPTYGLTEACSQVATRAPGDLASPLDGRLRALPGTQLKIVDEQGSERPVGTSGEICVRGATLMERYLDRPEATRRALREGWLYTGDVGRLDGEGCLEVFDRRSDLIISGGENVYPAEVEAVLLEHPAVQDAAVVGLEDDQFGERPLAWVVVGKGVTEVPAELSRFCRERLAPYKVPAVFRVAAELPRNSVGKLLRRKLRGEVSGLRPTR